MLHLIRSRKAVTTASSSIPLPPTIAAIAPVKMDPIPANSLDSVDPRVSYMPASSDSSMALPASARRGHRRPRTPDTTSASTTDASRTTSKEKYLRTLSPVEDDEGHPNDQQTYHDRIQQPASGCTNYEAA